MAQHHQFRSGRRGAIAALALSVLAAACGSSSATDDTSDAVDDVEAASEASLDASVRITVAVPATEEGMINGTKWWADEITERTDGQVAFEIFYADSLMPATEVLPGIRDGRVDAGWLSDPYWPTEFPLWQVVGIPFETADPHAGAAAFADLYEDNEAFRAEFDRAGVRPLHFLPYFPTMLGSREPVENLESLRGKRFRSVGYIAEALAAIDAEPTAVAAGEMYEAIQRGVLDGYAGFPLDIVTEFSLQEVAPYTVDLGVGHYASTAIGIGLEVWDSLEEDVQAVITEVSQELQQGRAISELGDLVDPVCEEYEEAGADLSVLPSEEVERWKDVLGSDLRDRWKDDAVERGVAPDVAEDFYEAYHEAYESHVDDFDWQDAVVRCADRLS